MIYSIYGLNNWNYNKPIKNWFILVFCLLSFTFSMYFIDKIKKENKVMKNTTKALCIILLVISVIIFIFSLFLLSQLPEISTN